MDGSYFPTMTSASDVLASVKQPSRSKTAEEFESVYLAQMLKPMFDTIEIDSEFGGGHAEETWRSVQVEEMAKQIARNGGIGLADSLAKEMLRLQEITDGQR
jgi:peptidoglycan hydrolase FlgJ